MKLSHIADKGLYLLQLKQLLLVRRLYRVIFDQTWDFVYSFLYYRPTTLKSIFINLNFPKNTF